MELRHLIYFKTVAELLHFSKAAAQLHISQPPLTRQIKELENELGAVLFHRNNKRVALTDAGRYFLGECELLIQQLERSKQAVRQIHQSVSGEFQIGYISSTPLTALAAVLRQLNVRYPLLKTRVYELSTAKQVSALEAGKLDVGILRAPVASTQLDITSLWQDQFALVCAAEHPVLLNADVLAKAPFISYNSTYAPYYHQQFIACCQRIGFMPQVIHECNSMHSILSLVESGLGVALVPVSIMQQYPYLKLQFTELIDIPVYTEIVMAHHRQTEHPALADFISLSHLFKTSAG
ncbi:LysR family transcriptional regulator [Parapedobacter lycopersici]|uniref:LysR family transcriptional regulator n=1 Tax=Parapedobacter lycopersici TaxID=1864939 RepID=UPI00214DD91F|nr:LysR substrate-binding domain-containing protein [Parapedobacter lycopersici]